MTIPFVQARHYTPTTGRRIDLLVVHTAETPEDARRAESLAAWAAGPTAPQASWHYAVDPDSIVQSVRDRDVAWAAPGANHDGLHIELAGRAGQTAAEWQDATSTRILRRAAELFAQKAREHGVPVVWLEPVDLVAGRRGITSHANVSRAFRRSDHWDPGPAFPRARFMRLIQQAAPSGSPVPRPETKPLPPTIRRGARGVDVKRLQTRLSIHGWRLVNDGVFGPATEQAVRGFQRVWGLTVDGIVGPQTWAALRAGPGWTQKKRQRRA